MSGFCLGLMSATVNICLASSTGDIQKTARKAERQRTTPTASGTGQTAFPQKEIL
jgi:hypothetical protein